MVVELLSHYQQLDSSKGGQQLPPARQVGRQCSAVMEFSRLLAALQ